MRCASTGTQTRLVEGRNGEKIIRSQYDAPEYSNALIHEHVWRDFHDFRDMIALECAVSGRKYTYSQARDAANYVARSLTNMGLKKGDVLALIAPNYPETVMGFLGGLEAGVVITTVNPFYTVHEIGRQLKSSGANAVITSAEVADTVLEAVRSCLPPTTPFIVIEDGVKPIPNGTIPFKDLITRGKSLPNVKLTNLSNEELAVLPYSSGTTGLPKGVMLTHKNLVANMCMLDVTIPELFLRSTGDFQEVIPLILPFFHIFGLNVLTLPRLKSGSRVVTLPKFTSAGMVNLLENHKVTGLFCVPPMVLFLANCKEVKRSHMETIRAAISGAAPLSESDVRSFYEKFNLDERNLKFCQGYGLTETSPVVFFEKSGTKYSSIGENIAGIEARIVDVSTKKDVCTPGQTGEMWIRGPNVMKGYLNNESATKGTFAEDGWLKTGDIAYFDEDFDFFITDRLKELIKVKGFQVAPAELEALLRTHPDVEEAAVIGVPDDRCGEVPKAFVSVHKDRNPKPEDIAKFLKGKVSEFKELAGGVTIVDNIPKSASGKILRSQIKAEFLPKK